MFANEARGAAIEYRENPFGILQRRYAAGDLTTEEYEDRKTRIERDLRDPRQWPLSPDVPDPNATS